MKIEIGTKVSIKAHWNWPKDCVGTIEEPPEFARRLVADQFPWNKCSRIVQDRKGPIEFIWIKFVEPQKDGDGDGPYFGGEVETEYISIYK